jgi:hypothetical protein
VEHSSCNGFYDSQEDKDHIYILTNNLYEPVLTCSLNLVNIESKCLQILLVNGKGRLYFTVLTKLIASLAVFYTNC